MSRRHASTTVVFVTLVFLAIGIRTSAAGSMSRGLEVRANGGELETVPVVILLSYQPGEAIARDIRSARAAEMDALWESIRAHHRTEIPTGQSLNEAQERDLATAWTGPDDPAVAAGLRRIREELDALDTQEKTEISRRLVAAVGPSQATLGNFIESLGGKVKGRLSAVNVMLADIPADRLVELAGHELVAAMEENLPGKPDLNIQIPSLGVAAFWEDVPPVDGWPWDMASIDSGVDHTHPDLNTHAFYKNYSLYDDGHGTSTTAIYASTDEIYRGLAFGLDAILVDNAGEEWESMEGFAWVTQFPLANPEVINYSWGHGLADDEDYGPLEAFFDGIVSTYNIPIAKSAGNEEWGTTTLNRPAGAHNVLTVSDVWDFNTEERSDDRVWWTSSTGPTLNGRRKPDLAAPGAYTKCSCLGDDPDGNICQFGGTSAAAPKVGAGALLLRSLGVSDSMAIRAVLINTADAWNSHNTATGEDDDPVVGSYWDMGWGWGYLDLWEAWFNGDDYFLDSVAAWPNTGWYDFYSGTMYLGEKATLVWNKRVEDNGIDYPDTIHDLTNLDMRLYDAASGESIEDADFDDDDNVHQVAAHSNGQKVVTVYAWDTSIDGLAQEPYALATEENFTKRTGPDLTSVSTTGLGTTCGESFEITASISNVGDLSAQGIAIAVELPPLGWALAGGVNPTDVGEVGVGDTAVVSWEVQPPAGAYGWYPFYFDPEGTAYGIPQEWRVQRLIEVRPAPANDLCGSATVIPPVHGTTVLSGDSTAACDDYDVDGACTGFPSAGRDLAYTVHLEQPTIVSVLMTPDETLDPVLYLITDCAVPGDCLAGSDVIGYGSPETFTVTVYPEPGGQDFFIIADAYGVNAGGPFDLQVSLAEAPLFADDFESGTFGAWSAVFP